MKVGDKATPFCLPDAEGKQFCIQDAVGRWVVLYFYPKDDTPGCTLEAIDFTKSINEFEKHNAVILGVSPDTKESHCHFRDKYNLKIRLLSDADHRIMEVYGVWVMKNTYGKSYPGVERTTFLIDPKGNIRAIWNKVKVPGHNEAVLDQLKEFESISKYISTSKNPHYF